MIHLFSHVGILVRDLEAALVVWRDTLGLTVVEELVATDEGIRSVLLSTGGAYREQTCIELISPLDPDDVEHAIPRRLTEHGEGLFHLAFRGDRLESTRSRLDDAGLRHRVLPADGGEVHSRIVLAPSATNGVLVEILSDLE